MATDSWWIAVISRDLNLVTAAICTQLSIESVKSGNLPIKWPAWYNMYNASLSHQGHILSSWPILGALSIVWIIQGMWGFNLANVLLCWKHFSIANNCTGGQMSFEDMSIYSWFVFGLLYTDFRNSTFILTSSDIIWLKHLNWMLMEAVHFEIVQMDFCIPARLKW